jgi:Raf kinase inhibitor-like YbhB/YbcL family protein
MSAEILLDEYLSRVAILKPEPIAVLFADAVDFYVPGSPEVPWTGRRRTRMEIVDFFSTASRISGRENLSVSVSRGHLCGGERLRARCRSIRPKHIRQVARVYERVLAQRIHFRSDEASMTFRLFSNELRDGGVLSKAHVLNDFGHEGENRSPHIAWEGVPEGTKSLVFTMYDPDAPTGSGFWHWVVVDIPPEASELRAGAGSGLVPLPRGARQTRTDRGTNGYVGGATPPGAVHRFAFTLHAVAVEKLPVPDDASGAWVGFFTNMNKVGEASFTVTY